MKLNRKWVLVIALLLSVAAATAGTLAYLTDRDSEVNTFTVGDVSIDLVEDFIQDSELLPGVKVPKETFIHNTGSEEAYVWMTMAIPAALDNNDTSTVGEKNALHWNVPGVVWKGYGDTNWATSDKIDTAKNNGWVSNEHIGENGRVKPECLWTICQTADAPVEVKTENIDGVDYNVYTFLYNGVLAPDAQTPVALHQVYLDTKIDVDPDGNWYLVDDGEAIELDWTNDDEIKVIVSAYAIQAEGVTDVNKDSETNVVDAYLMYSQQWGDNGAEWGENDDVTDAPIIPNGVYTLQDLIDAANKGGEYVLCADLNITEENVKFRSGRYITAIFNEFTLDLNGHNISVDLGDGEYADANNPPTLFYVYTDATLNIKGEGNLTATNDACLVWARSDSAGTNIYGGNYSNNNLTTGNPAKPSDAMAIIYSSGGPVNVYGGTYTFDVTNTDSSAFNVQNSNWYDNEIVLHEGVLLSAEMFCQPSDNGKIALAEGCKLEETVINGTTWYKVVKE